jgi:hypothetical protein
MVNRYLPLLSDPCLPRKLLPNQLRDFGLRVAFYWRHRLRVGRPRSSSLSQATEFDKLHPMISLEEFRAKRLGLVLMGGGAKGAYQIGAWRALWSSGVRHFSVIAGTSVGALNAVLIGKGSPRFAETVWFKVIDNQVLQGKADVSKRIRILLSAYLLALLPAIIAGALQSLSYVFPQANRWFVRGWLLMLLSVIILNQVWLLKRAATSGFVVPFFVLFSDRYKSFALGLFVTGLAIVIQSHWNKSVFRWTLPMLFGCYFLFCWTLTWGLERLHRMLAATPLFTRESLEKTTNDLVSDRSFANCTGRVWVTLTKFARYQDPYKVPWTFKRSQLDLPNAWHDLDHPITDWVPWYVDLTKESDPTWPLAATSALPFIFRAVKKDGDIFVDGGVRDNAPLAPILFEDLDYIIVIGVNRLDRFSFFKELRNRVENNWRQFFFSNPSNENAVNELRAAWVQESANIPDNISGIAANDPYLTPEPPLQKLIVVSPSKFISVPVPVLDQLTGTIRFTRPYAKRLMKLGFRDMRRALKQIESQ